MRVVALLRLILDVRDRDRDSALPLLRRLVNLVVRRERGEIFLRQRLGNRCRQCCLAMVHVPDRSYVQVRLVSDEFFFGHGVLLEAKRSRTANAVGDSIDNVVRNWRKTQELHGERCPPLRERTNVC